jgi:hypothetical protein
MRRLITIPPAALLAAVCLNDDLSFPKIISARSNDAAQTE